ncbi:neither inactivation nor afterpotential protein C [Cylas formicarius]|uniref:neither inactivation nor afterpotential protein C n=1 Tax=Cylas formicarius TaxID=197179 RepID=UPI0029587B5C|nr:neither inactivation nor afterpotential protein C [Cylas formicarius]
MKTSMDKIPDPGDRYTFGDLLGTGVFGKVYKAFDNQANQKAVAVKIQKFDRDNKEFVQEEYEILKEFSHIVYLVDFYGIFKRDNEIWFVLEQCEGNTVIDLVQGLLLKNRRMSEEHIAYILKELVKAIIYLHEHNVIHRDIKASNVLLTKEGEIKLCDFGLSKRLSSREGKATECVGSPCWMAPEVVSGNPNCENGSYDNRVDVWSLGITALEIAEGQAPFQNMHPTRALFQIVKNPPPSLQKISNWSENFRDFINECLVKFYEHRPYIMEVIDHPFLVQIPENNYHLSLEVKTLLEDIEASGIHKRCPEVAVKGRYLKRSIDGKMEKMLEEDLTDIGQITEEKILDLLETKTKQDEFYSFIGDILLSVNPNQKLNIYGGEFHEKYACKSRSDNAPHIYAIADAAIQNVLHHQVTQQIILTGESGSGKTANYLYLMDHLFHLASNHPVNSDRIKNGIKLIHSLTHASTPTNDYSTRCVLKTNVTLGRTGKLTAADFKVMCLDKWRVSSVDMDQSNFHIFYYMYDGMVNNGSIEKYKLNADRNYRYLRIPDGNPNLKRPRDNVEQNLIKYKKIYSYLEEYELNEEQTTTFLSVIAAILNLGEVSFKDEVEEGCASVQNREFIGNFAALMEVDEKKLTWALTNYCLVKHGNVIKKKSTADEARDARDVLANNLYCRLVDYVIGLINDKLAIGKQIFGEKFTIKLLDYFGFECFKRNHLAQFFVNCFNEQLQYHYVQRIFAWELLDLRTEELEYQQFGYADNGKTLNQLLSKPDGVLCIIDEASRKNLDARYVMVNVHKQETNRIMVTGSSEFAIAHYTGIVPYYVGEMADKNRDFLPPELIETMRDSENPIIKLLFTNKLDRTGNLNVHSERRRRRMIFGERTNAPDQFSQVKRMRTSAAIYRAVCLEVLKELSVGGSSGGTHFVRCIRSDLKGRPRYFNRELVKQQLRALAVTESTRIRQNGYPQRISFSEFLRRYQFLAFDFDENVEFSKENCRLLLIRLNMEGWAIGKSKVFLKYYNEEYLSRLYETQVKKIIKIQSIMRGFLAKCRINKKIKDQDDRCVQECKTRRSSVLTPDEAAEIIQKAYRRSVARDSKSAFDHLTEEECKFISPYAKKWKSPSMFQVLVQYRSARLHDFFNFSQQVHLYNQNAFYQTQKLQKCVDLKHVDCKAQVNNWLGEIKPAVLKVRFRLDEIPFYDTSCLCDALTTSGNLQEKGEPWDSPYRWRQNAANISKEFMRGQTIEDVVNVPYKRDPEEPLPTMPSPCKQVEDVKEAKQTKDIKEEENKATKAMAKSTNVESFTSIQLKKTTRPPKNEIENFTSNSAPANKDFEYFKASALTSKPKNADPIAELRNRAKSNTTSDDEPPFNFQGMLRKTNFNRDSVKKESPRRDSIKNAFEAVRKFSLTKSKEETLVNGEVDKAVIVSSRSVSMELIPGLMVHGIEVDL